MEDIVGGLSATMRFRVSWWASASCLSRKLGGLGFDEGAR